MTEENTAHGHRREDEEGAPDTVEIELQLTVKQFSYLQELQRLGLWGESIEDVCTGMILAGIREAWPINEERFNEIAHGDQAAKAGRRPLPTAVVGSAAALLASAAIHAGGTLTLTPAEVESGYRNREDFSARPRGDGSVDLHVTTR